VADESAVESFSPDDIVGRQVEIAIDGIEAIVFGRVVAVSAQGVFVRAEQTKLPRGLLVHTSPGPDPESPLVFVPFRKILMATVEAGEKK